MRIILDAMGGDYAPPVAVEGAVMAARELGVEVILVGREEAIRTELAKYDTRNLSLPIVHASQVIEMHEHPAVAVKSKPDSSMVVGMKMLKRGEADAFVSAGNSGGVLAAAIFHLGRIKGIKRPALATPYPTTRGFCFLIDVGANTDCKPEYLLQFALMGHVYAERVMGIKNPRIGLLSNGEEETKGTVVVQEAHQLLKTSGLNFIGNVEGKDIPTGMADVVVSDGFTGNVVVKLSEGLAMALMGIIKEEIKKRPLAVLGSLLAKPAFKAVAKRLDYREYGGGALLGVDGVVVIAHGRSDAVAIKNAIKVAKKAVEGGILQAIKEGLAELPQLQVGED
ncbi:MAG: phosphate acyltransferase PlsX [Anaerolineae bacterium]|nr:phosphate acyltransferase PlsX [Anaerolineae bacterium]MDW8101787.1 phosphate acyltransferase PlsX [Anaerolineae bacterium]